MSTVHIEIVIADDSEDLNRDDHELCQAVAEAIVAADWTGADLSLVHLIVTGPARARADRFMPRGGN